MADGPHRGHVEPIAAARVRWRLILTVEFAAFFGGKTGAVASRALHSLKIVQFSLWPQVRGGTGVLARAILRSLVHDGFGS